MLHLKFHSPCRWCNSWADMQYVLNDREDTFKCNEASCLANIHSFYAPAKAHSYLNEDFMISLSEEWLPAKEPRTSLGVFILFCAIIKVRNNTAGKRGNIFWARWSGGSPATLHIQCSHQCLANERLCAQCKNLRVRNNDFVNYVI